MGGNILLENVTVKYPESEFNVFENLNLTLPDGMVSLIGQNGTGKSTLLLLTAGILKPDNGNVFIDGKNSKEFTDETQRHKYVSFIYQNLEFESKDVIGDLLEFVYKNGFHTEKKDNFISQLSNVLELNDIKNKKTHEISKGELQRTILAFSLLYGSKYIMMDEPIFAMEDYQKQKIMDFLYNYSKENALSIYYSIHEIEISKKFSDYVLLFYKKSLPQLGKTKQMLVNEKLENAYEFPVSMLKQKELLFRESICKK